MQFRGARLCFQQLSLLPKETESFLLIVAVSITLSYYISYDIPELISGIEKWYKLFSDLSIGVIINFIFYVFQVYIPRREEEKATLRIIDPDLTKICQGIQEILLVAQTYY